MKIEINNADVKDLVRLNGIGEEKARRIVAYRKEKGSFTEKEELMNVKGIGRRVFAEIRNNLEVKQKLKFEFYPEEYNLHEVGEVHLVGEMNNWDPADKQYTLRKEKDGYWTAEFAIEPGTEYKFLYDSESWQPGHDIGAGEGQNLVAG